MSYNNDLNDIQMNPVSDEYMDVNEYDSYAVASHPEYGGFETPNKKASETVKKTVRIKNLVLKADLVASIALITAVAGPSILSDYFDDVFSPIKAEFVETIAETNEIDYYLSIESLEQTLGDVEIRISGPDYYEVVKPHEGKNIGEITGLKENTIYTIALYDGIYVAKQVEVKTLTQEEREKRAWRKFFENFLDIYYDKDSDILNFKMKIVDDLDRYEMLMLSMYDENDNSNYREITPDIMNARQEIPLRREDITGNEIHINVFGYLKFIEGQEEEMENGHEDLLYEGIYIIEEEEPDDHGEIVQTTEVVAELMEAIIDVSYISYYISIGNTEYAHGAINMRLDLGETERNFYLKEGKNIGTIYDLEGDTEYNLEIYDDDILVTTYTIKTLSVDEARDRNLTEFYDNFIDIIYEDGDLRITIKVIDDEENWTSYRILVKDSNDEMELTFESNERDYEHSFNLANSKITDNILEISFYASDVTGGEEELCTIEYNIEEGVYERKQ